MKNNDLHLKHQEDISIPSNDFSSKSVFSEIKMKGLYEQHQLGIAQICSTLLLYFDFSQYSTHISYQEKFYGVERSHWQKWWAWRWWIYLSQVHRLSWRESLERKQVSHRLNEIMHEFLFSSWTNIFFFIWSESWDWDFNSWQFKWAEINTYLFKVQCQR